MKVITAIILLFVSIYSFAFNYNYTPNISKNSLKYYLSMPKYANAVKYNALDNLGNQMQCLSILEIKNQNYKYAAFYHTPYNVSGGIRYKINLAGSNDLINWNFIRMLVDNADMPKAVEVTNSSWILLVHEQWMGNAAYSKEPSKIGFELFYNADDLLNGKIRSTYLPPLFQTSINGTPSIYDAHVVLRDGNYSVDGQFGFHFWNGIRDMNAVTTIENIFNPNNKINAYPSIAEDYNNAFIDYGVTGNIGQRDTVVTTNGRFNVQEGNIGEPAASWDLWRMWLFEFWDYNLYPTGLGALEFLDIKTHKGSTSFGNPNINIVSNPSGAGHAFFVSYYLFSEGAKEDEAGSLIYYFNIE